MKTLFFVTMFTTSMALAQTKETATPPSPDASHIEMHEKMSKAHQQAADCLKSGKSADECRQSFQAMCKDAGELGQCGMGGPMKGRKGWRK